MCYMSSKTDKWGQTFSDNSVRCHRLPQEVTNTRRSEHGAWLRQQHNLADDLRAGKGLVAQARKGSRQAAVRRGATDA